MTMDKIKNVIEYNEEATPKFSFDKKTISIEGQPTQYDFSMVIAIYNSEKMALCKCQQ